MTKLVVESGKEGVTIAKHAFRALIDLVQFDQAIAQVLHQAQASRDHIVDFQQQERNLGNALEESKHRLLEWRKLVDEKELLLKTLEGQERSKKEQLDRVHSNKEYVALQAEITQLKREQDSLEQEVVTAWNKRDMAHAEHDVLKDQARAKIAELRALIEQHEQKIAHLELQYAQLQVDRLAKEVLVPSEWLEKYNALGARIQDPVIAIDGDACGGCFSPLTNQELMRLNRGALLQCQSCFRFLYIPSAVGQ